MSYEDDQDDIIESSREIVKLEGELLKVRTALSGLLKQFRPDSNPMLREVAFKEARAALEGK